MVDSERSLLRVEDLQKHFLRTKGFSKKVIGTVKAVDKISFSIRTGETLALVGESGSGKTTTGRCILRAIEPTAGKILFQMNGVNESVNMVELDKHELKEIRKEMALIFQDPYASLNPRMNILEIVAEPFTANRIFTKRRVLEEKVAELLEMVQLNPEYMRRYPHAFSGGQRQRLAIARALALRPKFIVADEPVSALDVSVQADILNLLKKLQEDLGLTYLFIAHNLSVVEYISDRIAVMYVGKIVELAPGEELLSNPKHPYTEALLSAIPRPDPQFRKRTIVLEGDIADPANPPSGCYFHPRCRYAKKICEEEAPPFEQIGDDREPHYVACHLATNLKLLGIKD